MATSIAVQQEALTRAVSSQSLSNYAAIIRGFMAKGFAESEISPRENVFTYNAWKALGRQVKKGEHGVRCLTFIVQRNKRTGRDEKRPWTTTVFHISQTEKVGAIACNAALDATDENTPYAGEEHPREWNIAELAQDRVNSRRAARINSLQIVDHDATPENVPFAGEDEASRASGLDDAIAALSAPLSIEEMHQELATSGARFEHIKTGEVDWLLTPATAESEVIPAPAPKDSAYDRAMRGETVSIMEIISEQQAESKPAPCMPSYSRSFPMRTRAQSSFQTKTVDF